MLNPTAKLESLRKYVEYALEKAQPAAQLTGAFADCRANGDAASLFFFRRRPLASPSRAHRIITTTRWLTSPTRPIGRSSRADLLDDELQLILSKVNATNGSSPKQLLALSTVSKRFAKLVRQPAVWRDLDVSSHASFLTDRVLNSIVRDDGAFGMLRSVSLAGCTRVTETEIVTLLNACGNSLERLDISGCTLVKTSTIEHAARTCTNLTLLDLTGCAHVDTLDALKMTDTFWPKLEEVRLVGTSRLSGRVCQTEFDALADEIASRWNRWREARREGRRQALLAAEMEADALKVKLATGREPAGLAELLSAEDERRRALEDLESDDAVALEEELHIDHAECDCGPAVSLEAMPALVRKCRRWVEAWQEGHPVSACDHALVMQGAMGEQAGLATLNLFPNCGHVMCEVCEQKERVNMQRRPVEGGEFEYVYPCRLCNQDMPNPGGFEITLTQ